MKPSGWGLVGQVLLSLVLAASALVWSVNAVYWVDPWCLGDCGRLPMHTWGDRVQLVVAIVGVGGLLYAFGIGFSAYRRRFWFSVLVVFVLSQVWWNIPK